MIHSTEHDNELWAFFARQLKKSCSASKSSPLYGAAEKMVLEANENARHTVLDRHNNEVDVESIPEDAAKYLADEMADAAHNRLREIARGDRRLNYSRRTSRR
jgi:hypothetical protein